MDDALTVHRLHFAFTMSCLQLLGVPASAAYGLRVGLGWWLFGMALVAVSFTVTYRRFAGRVSAAPGEGNGRPLAGTGGCS